MVLEEESKTKKCVVYYKKGWRPDAQFAGEKFDQLNTCCATFEETFYQTGNTKNTSWDQSNLFDEKPGLNFLKKEGVLNIFFCGKPIQFCPWCSCAVEVQKSREVTVKQKTKEVPDGYEEAVLVEGWDQ